MFKQRVPKPMHILPLIPEESTINFKYDLQSWLEDQPRYQKAVVPWNKKQMVSQITSLTQLIEAMLDVDD